MSTQTETFTEPDEYSWTVPDNVYEIYLQASGAGSPGSNGGYAEGWLDVTPGEELIIRVGGSGSTSDRSGGFNGGGNGGVGEFSTDEGVGGGGATDVRRGGSTLSDRILVAGGGGGYRSSDSGDPGDGGGLVGGDGDDAGTGVESGATGGTQTSGGDGAVSDGSNGSDGEFGSGGNAGGQTFGIGGGGGGGGWYGGGGGAGGEGGWEATAGAGGSSYIDGVQDGATTTGGGNSGDGELTIEYEPAEMEPADNLEAVDERDTEIDLAWDSPDDADGQRLYRDIEPDIDVSESEPIAEFGTETTSYTDTDRLNGTGYFYIVETYRGGDFPDTALSNEAAGQTTLPDVEDFELDASVQDELTVEEIVGDLNTGQYRVRWKRSTSEDYDPLDEVTIPYDGDPLEYTISPVLDGEEYDVGVRSESDEVDGTWLTASEITKLVPVTDISFDPVDGDVVNYESDLEISWTVESDIDGAIELYRIETTNDDGDGLGELIAALEADAESYVDGSENLRPGRDYTYTVRTTTEYIHADNSATFESSRAGLQEPIYVQIHDPRREDPITLDPPKAIRNVQLRHSGTSDIEIATQDLGPALRELGEINPDIELRERPQEADGTVVRDDRIIKGVLGEVETQAQSDEATLRCKGRGWFLETDTPEAPHRITNERVWEAIEAYAAQHLDDWGVEVTPDPGAPIATDEIAQTADVQEEWLDLLEDHLADTDPFYIENGSLWQSQCSFTPPPPGPFDDGDAPFVSDESFSHGIGVGFDTSGQYRDYGPVEVTHTIDSNDVGVAARIDTTFADEDQNGEVELQLRDLDSDDVVDSVTLYSGSEPIAGVWRGFGDDFVTGLNGGDDSWNIDIEPGEYYFRLVCTDSATGDGDQTVVDIFSVFDSRYDYNWDENLHEDGGYLDGPEDYPVVDLVLPLIERETNIDAARIESTWTDTSADQAIALSNDGGDNWIVESNTGTLEANFAEEGYFSSQLVAKLTFSGHPADEDPQDDTPRYRYEGQSVDEYELRFDQSSVAVVNDTILSDDHKSNLNTLCDRGRMNWVVDHTADGKKLHVFPIGTPAEDGAEWKMVDANVTDGSFNYGNRVIARGARKPEEEREDEDDLRYEAVVEDEDEIQRRLDMGLDEDKAIVTRPDIDPEWDTQEEVNQQAFSSLEELVESRLPTGTVDIVPTLIMPGYSRPVPEFEDADGNVPEKVLEKVTLSQQYGSANGQLEFESQRNLVRALDEVEGDVGALKRLF